MTRPSAQDFPRVVFSSMSLARLNCLLFSICYLTGRDASEVFQDMSVIHGGVAVRDLDLAPAFERREHHEEIGGAVARVLIVATRRAAGFHRDRHARLGDELL